MKNSRLNEQILGRREPVIGLRSQVPMICSRLKIFYIVCLALTLVFSSCHTQAKAEKRLTPPKSVKDFRLDDIAKQITENPVRAIHLIKVYELIYGQDSVYPDGADPEVRDRLDSLHEKAIEAIKAAQARAIEEKKWTEAVSYARSLARMGITVPQTGEEQIGRAHV